MEIAINRKQITNKFLNAVSKLTDKCVMNIKPESVQTLTNNDDGSVVLFGKLDAKIDMAEDQKDLQLNIPDVKKLTRILNCLEDENIKLKINSNSLTYNSDNIKFTYHLLEDGIIENSVISVDKINKLTFDCEFDLSSKKLSEILKSSTFTTESNKIYFFTKDNHVFAELTDKAINNLDSVTLMSAENFTGSEIKQVVPVSLEIFRLFAGFKKSIKVKINTSLKVLMFDIEDKDLTLKYIVSALVK